MRPKTKQFTFSIALNLFEKFSLISEEQGVSFAECLRRAIQDYIQEFEKRQFGYKGIQVSKNSFGKKTKVEQFIEAKQKLEALSCDELREHLILIGYFPAGGEELNSFGNIISHKIEEIDGVKTYVQYQRAPLQPATEYSYRSVVFNFMELINDLKKEGKFQ